MKSGRVQRAIQLLISSLQRVLDSARDFKVHGRILGIKGDEPASAKLQARSRPSQIT
jgi:hypothetical protein